jgi:hypothetical protein
LVGFADEGGADEEEVVDVGVFLAEGFDGDAPVFDFFDGGEDGAQAGDEVVADLVVEFGFDGVDGFEDAVAEGEAFGVGGGPPAGVGCLRRVLRSLLTGKLPGTMMRGWRLLSGWVLGWSLIVFFFLFGLVVENEGVNMRLWRVPP